MHENPRRPRKIGHKSLVVVGEQPGVGGQGPDRDVDAVVVALRDRTEPRGVPGQEPLIRTNTQKIMSAAASNGECK